MTCNYGNRVLTRLLFSLPIFPMLLLLTFVLYFSSNAKRQTDININCVYVFSKVNRVYLNIKSYSICTYYGSISIIFMHMTHIGLVSGIYDIVYFRYVREEKGKDPNLYSAKWQSTVYGTASRRVPNNFRILRRGLIRRTKIFGECVR